MHTKLEAYFNSAWESSHSSPSRQPQTVELDMNALNEQDFIAAIKEIEAIEEIDQERISEKNFKLGLAYLLLIAKYLFLTLDNDTPHKLYKRFRPTPEIFLTQLNPEVRQILIDSNNHRLVKQAITLAELVNYKLDDNNALLKSIVSCIDKLNTEDAKKFAQVFNCCSLLFYEGASFSISKPLLVKTLLQLALKTGEPLAFLSQCFGYYPLADESYLPASAGIPLRELMNETHQAKELDASPLPGYSLAGEEANTNQVMRQLLDNLAQLDQEKQCEFLKRLLANKSAFSSHLLARFSNNLKSACNAAKLGLQVQKKPPQHLKDPLKLRTIVDKIKQVFRISDILGIYS